MRKTRIAFVASTLDVGGAETVLYNLLNRLPKDSYDTELLLLRSPGTIGRRLAREGIRGADTLERGRYDPTVFFRLVRRLKAFSPDVLFCLDHHNALFWGRLASLAAGVPRRVVASHSTGRLETRRSFTRVDRLFMVHTDAVVALSSAHASYLERVEGIDARKIVIIENGIDVGRYERVDGTAVRRLASEVGIREGEGVVVMVAALRPEKAHEAFLDAARMLTEKRPDLRLKFLVVGDGPRRAAIEALRSQLALEDRLLLLGEREDVAEILHLSDVLVLPSHGAVETLPLAVLEAMAAGVPVVASAVGSVPEIIQDGRSGKLIAPADAVGLADAICHIFDKSQETQQIREQAKATVRERYSVERMISKYEDLFDRLTDARTDDHGKSRIPH